MKDSKIWITNTFKFKEKSKVYIEKPQEDKQNIKQVHKSNQF